MCVPQQVRLIHCQHCLCSQRRRSGRNSEKGINMYSWAVSQYYHQSSSSPAIKYHGLLNQGATCYLNSVLQVLFMTEDFREAVKQHKQDNPDTKCIDCDLTPLFDDLEQREAYTFKITNTLGIKRVYEQQDAAEYFEKILGLTSPEASKIFRGQLTRTTECSTCLRGPKSDGAFWHLPLELVESYSEDYSVVNGIEEFFRDSDLSGENQMYCDECDDKSDAKIKCAMKDHPEVLMLLLKRFEFDYQYMAYVKINCTVAVPYTLQIPGNQTYELYAVVDHSGDLRSGHYTATIKSQHDDQWYKFNDSRVTLCDYQPFQVDKFEKSRSAYLLFYRKKKVHAADTCPQDITEVSAPGGFSPADAELYYPYQDDIEMRETESVEVVEDVSNEPAVAVSSTNEEAGIKDITPGVRGAKPSAAPYSISVEGQGVNVRQSLSYNQQECDEERKDVGYHPQDAHADKQRYDGKVVTDDEKDMRGNAESEGEAEKRGTSLRGTQHEESVDDQGNDSAGVDDVRHQSLEVADILDPSYQRYKQESSSMHARCDDPQQICVDKQRDEDRMVVGVNRDKDREMEGNEQSERREKSSVEHHEDKEFDVRKDMHGGLDSKQEIGQHYSLIPVRVDKQEPDVKVDEEDETGADDREVASGSAKGLTKSDLVEQKTGDDKYAKRKETPMTNPNLTKGVEGQDTRRSDDVRQDRPQQKVSVDKQANKPTQHRTDSSLRQADSRKVAESRGVEGAERTGYNDSAVEGRHGSKIYAKRTESEVRETHSIIKGSSETDLQVKTTEETVRQHTVLVRVRNLNLSESPSQEPQQRGTNRVITNTPEENDTIQSIPKEQKKHATEKTGEHEKDRTRWWLPRLFACQKPNRKEKKKQKKPTGCCISCISPTSESD